VQASIDTEKYVQSSIYFQPSKHEVLYYQASRQNTLNNNQAIIAISSFT